VLLAAERLRKKAVVTVVNDNILTSNDRLYKLEFRINNKNEKLEKKYPPVSLLTMLGQLYQL
jgi:hypothetical protein